MSHKMKSHLKFLLKLCKYSLKSCNVNRCGFAIFDELINHLPLISQKCEVTFWKIRRMPQQIFHIHTFIGNALKIGAGQNHTI